MIDLQKDIHVFSNRKLAGIAAGKEVEKYIVNLQEEQDEVRVIFAAAPSQTEMLTYLASSDQIRWDKLVAFHMDEYIGLDEKAPELFASYLEETLFSKVPFKEVHLIKTHGDIAAELSRYEALLSKGSIDLVCLGIGENGHIAFNDPPVADFYDPLVVKVVDLEEACRVQQVNDKCFDKLGNVPTKAVTLTVPTLMAAKAMVCVVLGEKKSQAVHDTLTQEVSTACPASILTTHLNCKFYFNQSAVSKLDHHTFTIVKKA
ncbi:6-phosphogluconolactonase [Algoriphagus sp. AGSA1]|uniref:6-phosphogluconolactonase n=1 Tax=Algoriphagus sp. AGSA1 TaxID=2907213 RepID=UPI001F42726A|nr:6-phosphogluconolactonase [Algoriphagus sp. AGSA1]MCE7055005.1 6-phosphogluconolactonase [Algoriphagus sp. AGSA1]